MKKILWALFLLFLLVGCSLEESPSESVVVESHPYCTSGGRAQLDMCLMGLVDGGYITIEDALVLMDGFLDMSTCKVASGGITVKVPCNVGD